MSAYVLCAMCRFSDAGNRGSIDTRGRPASEKRQGRKSRLVVQRRCGVRYGDLAAGLGLKGLGRSGCRGRLAANPGRADRGERSVGTLPDGICDADAGQSGGRAHRPMWIELCYIPKRQLRPARSMFSLSVFPGAGADPDLTRPLRSGFAVMPYSTPAPAARPRWRSVGEVHGGCLTPHCRRRRSRP